ncbi:urease isoform X1 [Tanacetum coccineum]
MLHRNGSSQDSAVVNGYSRPHSIALTTSEKVLPTVHKLLDPSLVKGTFPDVPSLEKFLIIEGDTIPGELILINGHILLNFGRKAVILKFAEVEKDFVVYGDECVFGGGKVMRDGMGLTSRYSTSDCLDTVITNALIIDYTNIGIKGGCISAIGKAGYPDAMNGVFSNMIIGLAYEAIASGITTMGLKLHEDWGTTPAVIDNCLTVVDQYDI